MSFLNNCKSEKIPGPLKCNPLNCLCEKACIQCDKILDMCMNQDVLTDVPINVEDVEPSGLVQPFRFLSARTTSEDAMIENLIVTEFPDNSCNSRVQCTVRVPIQVIFIDANGTQAVGIAYVCVDKDVVLHTSAPSVMPYEIVASAAIVSNKGVYLGGTCFSITCCCTVILKVLMKVQLLIPSYGYCFIPPCQNYTESECEGVFDVPLYPQECGVEPRCNT